MSEITPHEFYLDTIGKAKDVDGYYGAQCWDLFAYFNQKMKYPIINCTRTGYVKDIANDMNTNGILKNYVSVAKEAMQDGDWIVFGETQQTPYSHIAMVRKVDGKDPHRAGEYLITVLGQNQGGKQAASQIQMSTYGALRIFRPKAYVKPSTPANKGYVIIKTSGTFQFTRDQVRIRTAPSTSAAQMTNSKGEKLDYNSGMKVNYVGIVHAENRTWLKYIRAYGGFAYVAICDTDGTMWGKVV